MLKYNFTTLLIICLSFSSGVKRTVNVNVHRSAEVGIFGVGNTEVTDFGIGMTEPLSHYIGLKGGLSGFGLGSNETYKSVIAGEIGLIEQFSTKYISPYLLQHLRLGYFQKRAENDIKCFVSMDIGIEFLSNSIVSPFVEGGYVLWIEYFGIRYGGGIRFSLTK